MSTANLVHSNIVSRFQTLTARGRLAHAYLFIGPKGIGKKETALEVARLVNCVAPDGYKPGCTCSSCTKIKNGNHPDVYLVARVDEDKTVISAEQIRDLIDRLELRAMEARIKVAIVENAEEMSIDCANIFLKTLEEPNRQTLLILTTSAADRLLPTVLSRCQQVLFFPLSHGELAEWVKNEYHVESPDAQILARLADGSPGLAREQGKDFIRKKNEIINRFILGPADDATIKAYCGDRDQARQFLGIVLTFFRDVAMIRRGASGSIVHTDRMSDLTRLAHQYSDSDLDGIISQTVSAIKGIKEHMNVRISVTLLKEMIQTAGRPGQ